MNFLWSRLLTICVLLSLHSVQSSFRGRVGGKSRTVFAAMALLCGAVAACAQSEHSRTAPLKQVGDIPLPGAAVRFDYQSFDPSQGRLYISHMNANQLVVFDVNKREGAANLDGFTSVHGVLAVPDLSRVYASVTCEHTLALVDPRSLKTSTQSGPINYAAGLTHAPGLERVF